MSKNSERARSLARVINSAPDYIKGFHQPRRSFSLAAPLFEEADPVSSPTDYSERLLEADDVFVEEPRRSEFDEIKPRFQPIEGESGRRERKRKGKGSFD